MNLILSPLTAQAYNSTKERCPVSRGPRITSLLSYLVRSHQSLCALKTSVHLLDVLCAAVTPPPLSSGPGVVSERRQLRQIDYSSKFTFFYRLKCRSYKKRLKSDLKCNFDSSSQRVHLSVVQAGGEN